MQWTGRQPAEPPRVSTRGSVSRVLSTSLRWMGDHSSTTRLTPGLQQSTRTTGRSSPYAVPIRSCSRWGLPCRPRYRVRGALLPHPFDLAGSLSPPGGLLSVALSLGSPPPGVTRHRYSLEPGLSSPHHCAATARPSGGAGLRRFSAWAQAMRRPRGGATGAARSHGSRHLPSHRSSRAGNGAGRREPRRGRR